MPDPSSTVSAGVDPKELTELFIIKGHRCLSSTDPLDLSTLRFFEIRRIALLKNLSYMNERLLQLLETWGFTDEIWNAEAATAVMELLTNICQHVHRGPRGVLRSSMHLYCQTISGKRYDYFYAFTSGDGDVSIEIDRLKTRLRRHFGAHGRGTGIVKAFTDFFAIILGTDGVIIMKRSRHPSL